MALTEFVEGIVHEPTQTEGAGLDLTVAGVRRVVEPGRVDFGGGELEPAETEPIETEHRNPDDDYGWWALEDGVYLIEYNETVTVPDDERLVLQTRDAIRARGAFHPTIHPAAGEPVDPVPLAVGDGGLLLKENARVSTLVSA